MLGGIGKAGLAARWRVRPIPRVGLATVVVLALMGVLPSAATQLPADSGGSTAPVEQAVVDEVAAEGKADFWVIFDEQADVSRAYSIEDWGKRGQYVYDQLTTTAQAAQAAQAAFIDELAAQHARYESFWIVNAVLVRGGDQATLDWARSQAEVGRIAGRWEAVLPEPDELSKPDLDERARTQALEWNIERIRASQVWEDFQVRGEGVTVATIDTGVDFEHPALIRQYRGNLGNGTFDHNYNWWAPEDSSFCFDPEAPQNAPCDSFLDGTHNMGIIVGEDAGGQHQVGVAPGARWIAAQGCPGFARPRCPDDVLMGALQFVLAPTDLEGKNPRADLRPHVVNSWWGHFDGEDETWREAVRALEASGIFPVFAAGADAATRGCGSVQAPASYPESYAVGASDRSDEIFVLSSRGPSLVDGGVKPDIAAPGVDVRSAIPLYFAETGGVEPYYTRTSFQAGTSHVAGAVALLLSASPELVGDVDAIAELLNDGAVPIEDLSCGGEPDHNNVWGHGRLDAYSAVEQSPRRPAGFLTGTVTDAVTSKPISGATVTVDGLPRETTTAADGTIYVIGLPVGTWNVRVSAAGYRLVERPVEILEGETAALRVALSPLPSLSGTVMDANDGDPVAAEVTAVQGDNSRTVRVGDDGTYHLSLPDIGKWSVTFESDNYARESRKVQVADFGEEITLNVELRTGVASTDIDTIDTVLRTDSERTFDVRLRNTGTADLNWAAFEGGGLRGDLDPGDVRASWSLPEDTAVYGIGYADTMWTAEWRGERRGPWTHTEYGTDGTPTGRAFVASWLPDADNPLAGHSPGQMAFDTTRGWMCEIHRSWTEGRIFCWDPDSGELMATATGSPWNAERSEAGPIGSNRGIAYNPNDDTFYVGVSGGSLTHPFDLKSTIYQVAGFSHPTPGETLGQCAVPGFGPGGEMIPDYPVGVGGVIAWWDLAYNNSFDVLWVTGGHVHRTRGYRNVFWRVDPEDCTWVEAFQNPVRPTDERRGQLPWNSVAMDEHGNLWAKHDISGSEVYLVESGLPEFVDVPWLDVSVADGDLVAGSDQELEVTIDTVGLEPGVYTAQVVLRTNAARERDVFVPIRVLVTEYVQGVNVGGSASTGHSDSSDDAWVADQAFDGSWGYEGRSRSVTRRRPIDGIDNDGLYQQQRTGQGFDYRFEDLPNGTYDVELHFAEILGRQPGRRRFDVIANGVPVLVSYDVAESVSSETAAARTFQVEVTSGSLRLGLERRVGFGQPAVAAIRLTHRPDLSDQ